MAQANFAKESFKGLPMWAKGIIAVAIVGGIGFVIYKIYKKGQGLKEEKSSKEEVKDVNKELDKLNQSQSTKQTLSSSDAQSISNKIFTAMDGWGTDTSTIEQQLKRLQNQADWLAVRASWGVREVSSGTGNPEPNFKGSLEGALTSELGTFDESMRKRVNDDFTKKGIIAKI